MRTFMTLCGVLCSGLVAMAAGAESQESLPGYCLSQQTATLSMQVTASGPDVQALKKNFDDGIASARAVSPGLGITKMRAAGTNYTIQPSTTEGILVPYNGPAPCLDCIRRSGETAQRNLSYRLYGNVNFQVEPAGKALALAERLGGKGMTVSVSFVDVTKPKDRCALSVSSGTWQ